MSTSARLARGCCPFAFFRGAFWGRRPLGGDAFEEFAGRFVAGILGHELAGEGVAKNGLPQRLRALQLGREIGFEVIDDRELVFDDLDDSFLLGERRLGNWQLAKIVKV